MIRYALISIALATMGTTLVAAVEPVKVAQHREADGSYRMVHEVVVAGSPQAVWQAIATAEGWQSWAVPLARMVEPDLLETSYDPAAALGGPTTIRQRFIERVPGRKLVFRTVKGPEGFKQIDSFSKVTSVFELEPAGEGRTLVRLSGSGYSDDETGRQLLGFFRTGNQVSLEMLRTRFEEGPIDWRKRLGALRK
jgi:uncharacterized protein YndB with AHSA1/START domain